MIRNYRWLVIFAVTFGGCTKTPATAEAVLTNYGAIVHASYQDSLTAAQQLRQAVEHFVASPSEPALRDARRAWLGAREWYGQTEAFRFYGGPIDDADGPEGQINAWPLDEAYIDAIKGRPNSGIVNNPRAPINKAALASLNEKGGEENISTGWHAIEFMLWGQDLSETGPGNRAYTDFVDGKAKNADRRRRYLQTVTELLVDDLDALVKEWAPGADNYRKRFVADPKNVAKIFTGIGVLSRGELAGERLEVALDTHSQEDEHSCFADNTHRDVVANARGIRNVWRGEYYRLDGSLLNGPGLDDLVTSANRDIGNRASAYVEASVHAAEAIPAPFDRALSPDGAGRDKVQATVDALKKQADGLVSAADALGIRLNTALLE